MIDIHAGVGRPWQVDCKDKQFYQSSEAEFKVACDAAKKLQDKFDWWELIENGRAICGWSTGRTTTYLMEIDRASAALRLNKKSDPGNTTQT